jgi:hypothetical protein
MMQTDYTSSYLPNFAYTQADVEANRQGLLTPDQVYLVEAVYRARQRGARQTYLMFAIWIPVLIIVGIIIEYNQSGKSVADFLPSALPIVVAVSGGLALIMLLSWIFTTINARDARNKRISVAEGEAQVIEQEARTRGSSYMRYELRLGNRLFRFANHASIAHFEDGKTYRVYYIKYYPFPLMLSAEEI